MVSLLSVYTYRLSPLLNPPKERSIIQHLSQTAKVFPLISPRGDENTWQERRKKNEKGEGTAG
jgi:hypothetical protein